MKLMRLLLVAAIAFSSALSVADEKANYRYSGNVIGKQVCRAIVEDDVNALRRALRSYRQTLVYAYSINNPAHRALTGSFTCNDMELREFSYSVGSPQALGFLTTGSGVVVEQMVSTAK